MRELIHAYANLKWHHLAYAAYLVTLLVLILAKLPG
jgi:uncharacterized membrane protein YcgQ (UPF0703/DUF1980 family)